LRVPKAAYGMERTSSDVRCWSLLGAKPLCADRPKSTRGGVHVFVSYSSASLPRGHTGPGRGCTDTGRGYMGGLLGRRTLLREIAILRRSWFRTFAWRQSPVPKPQAISQRQSPRREILSPSSSSSSPMPIYLLDSFIRHSSHAVCPGPTIREYRTMLLWLGCPSS